ncbi:hypothetical protein RCH06_001497 [Polaromonas sp. CG_9.5]|uniref:hypothetical protein n=1 Tax=Polaromonas sp. CG_9.5 TaxID=3071705 RepID=UPI002DF7359D|nr:hypothetical protein [Polaromonas sp. CG_9.5]
MNPILVWLHALKAADSRSKQAIVHTLQAQAAIFFIAIQGLDKLPVAPAPAGPAFDPPHTQARVSQRNRRGGGRRNLVDAGNPLRPVCLQECVTQQRKHHGLV